MCNPDAELARELGSAYLYLANKATDLHVKLVGYSSGIPNFTEDPYMLAGRRKLQRIHRAMEWLDSEIENLLL
jgi:hypothetical protein